MSDKLYDESIEFIYGDDFGAIEIEELGTHQGTTTRQAEIPKRLAIDLYEQLHKELEDATDRYLVYGKEGYSIANIVIVEATSEDNAIQKAEDSHAAYIGSRPTAHRIDDLLDRSAVWAAVI